MKKIFSSYLFLLISFLTYSQSEIDLNGVFLDSRDTFYFYQDSVSFQIMTNGGIISPMEGKGIFKINENILTIKTGKHKNGKIKRKESITLGDKIFIEDKTLIFLIDCFDKEKLNLTLLGIIENSKYQEKKTTKKFLRENKKFKYRERKLKKN